MKKLLPIILTSAFITLFFVNCKTSESVSHEEEIAEITNKIDSANYIFHPQTALPMRGRAVDLNYDFSLKVTPDTINSYLPYFGRAFTAPVSSTEGGITFVSTDFDYKISDEKKGTWDVVIETKDTPQRYKLFLKIGNTGYTTLTVQENNREPITFYGKIE